MIDAAKQIVRFRIRRIKRSGLVEGWNRFFIAALHLQGSP